MNEHPNNPSEDDFDDEVIRYLVRTGAAFPTTPEQVRAAAKRLAESGHKLPDRLKNASQICKRLLAGDVRAPNNVVQMPTNHFAEAKEELLRAARNGRAMLSPKVEEKMRLNRTNAKAPHG